MPAQRRNDFKAILLTIGGAALVLGIASVLFDRVLKRKDARFARAIVGSTKRAIESALGPPRVATFVGSERTGGDFRDADLWYYALPKNRRAGLAIRFGERHAERVEFFKAPGHRKSY